MTQTPLVWFHVVQLPENRSALRAVHQLTRSLAQAKRCISPLVLHGPTGTGKTTLVDALVRAVSELPIGLTVQVMAANDLDPRGDSSDEDEPDAEPFAAQRTCDLLILEDIQYLPTHACEMVERWLDERAARRRPTVMTANAGPAALTALPRRVTSRLSAGLVLPLESLGPASRAALLTYHADRLNLKISSEAIDWLAAQPTGGGIRPILGKLRTLQTLAPRENVLSCEDARQLLGEESAPQSLQPILTAVGKAFGVTSKLMLGSTRLKTPTLARQTAMYLARTVAGWSLPTLGREFGRDHSTVLHAIRKVEELLAADAEYAAVVRQLQADIR